MDQKKGDLKNNGHNSSEIYQKGKKLVCFGKFSINAFLCHFSTNLNGLVSIFQNTPTFSLSDGFQRSYGYFLDHPFFGPPCSIYSVIFITRLRVRAFKRVFLGVFC